MVRALSSSSALLLLVLMCVLSVLVSGQGTYSQSPVFPSGVTNGSVPITDYTCAPTPGKSYPLIIQAYKSAAGFLSSIQTFYNNSGTTCDGAVWGLSNGTRWPACNTPAGARIDEVQVFYDNPPNGAIYQLQISYTNGGSCSLGDQTGTASGLIQVAKQELGYFAGQQIVNVRPTQIGGLFYVPTNSSNATHPKEQASAAEKWYTMMAKLKSAE